MEIDDCSFGIHRLDQPIAFGMWFNLEVLSIGSTVTSVFTAIPIFGRKGMDVRGEMDSLESGC